MTGDPSSVIRNSCALHFFKKPFFNIIILRNENDFNRMLSNKGISPGDFGRLSYAQCVTEKLIKREGTTC
ncbi:TPA: hypothetical protein ACKFQO_004711, partial [Enterobacter hormaechei]